MAMIGAAGAPERRFVQWLQEVPAASYVRALAARRPADAHRREDDAPVLRLDLEILGMRQGADHRFGQGDLVLGRELGKHGSL